MGAFARGQASADERLKDHQDIRALVHDLLDALGRSLYHCRSIYRRIIESESTDLTSKVISSVQTNHTLEHEIDSAASTTSDEQQNEHRESVERTLSYLTTLAIAIRKAGSRYRDLRAEEFGKSHPDYQFRREETRDYIKSMKISGIFRQSRRTDERLIKHADVQTPVLERLVECNMNRWSRLVYAKRHDKILSGIPGVIAIQAARESHIIEPNVLEPLKEPDLSPNELGDPTEQVKPETVVSKQSTAGTPIDRKAYQVPPYLQPDNGPDGPPLKLPGSFIAGKLSLKYPKPPKVIDGLEYFQCSCCRQPLPIEYAEKENWRFVF
jgi:hypothetical protein